MDRQLNSINPNNKQLLEAKKLHTKTNADRIRALSDEELAQFIRDIDYWEDDTTPKIYLNVPGKDASETIRWGEESILKWLQSKTE